MENIVRMLSIVDLWCCHACKYVARVDVIIVAAIDFAVADVVMGLNAIHVVVDGWLILRLIDG